MLPGSSDSLPSAAESLVETEASSIHDNSKRLERERARGAGDILALAVQSSNFGIAHARPRAHDIFLHACA